MSRLTQVQYEQVASACAELFRADDSVSCAKVYQRIGSRGGQQVVTDMIRRWRQDIAQRVLAEREHPQLPPVLVQASDGLIASLWQQALVQAQQGHLQQAEVLAQREVEWQQKLDAAQAAVDQMERENLEGVASENGKNRTLRDARCQVVAIDRASMVSTNSENGSTLTVLPLWSDVQLGHAPD